MMALQKSIVGEAREVQRAIELIRLDARLQVLESELSLSRERLLRLYKEVAGRSPAKGMLPFSTDWFMTWQPNVHSSLFVNIYQTLVHDGALARVDALIRAFKLYAEHVQVCGLPQVLSITRAWRLVKFLEANMLGMAACTRCTGRYVVHRFDPTRHYVCGLCDVPARAGKTRSGSIVDAAAHPESEAAEQAR